MTPTLRVTFQLDGVCYRAHPERAVSLAIPIDFGSAGVTAFGVAPATSAAVTGPGFVGDTGRGGACNVGALHLVPHCHGTHTECVGHLVDDLVSVDAVLREPLIPATLVSVATEPAAGHPESDPAITAPGDRLVSARALQQALGAASPFLRAVVIRTLPNAITKCRARYDGAAPPPYLSAAAGTVLAGLGCEHVVVDLPSLDRMMDGGKLAAHRAFFGLPAGSRAVAEASRAHCTITELAFVADELDDGRYLLDLQLAPLTSDAAPSRPLLIPIEEQPLEVSE